MKQNKNRGLWLAGTVCAALAAIACLIVEYGYEKIILPRGYQWMYPWMQTAVLTGAVVFTVLAVLCQLPASGKKKITAIGCVIVAGIGAQNVFEGTVPLKDEVEMLKKKYGFQ